MKWLGLSAWSRVADRAEHASLAFVSLIEHGLTTAFLAVSALSPKLNNVAVPERRPKEGVFFSTTGLPAAGSFGLNKGDSRNLSVENQLSLRGDDRSPNSLSLGSGVFDPAVVQPVLPTGDSLEDLSNRLDENSIKSIALVSAFGVHSRGPFRGGV